MSTTFKGTPPANYPDATQAYSYAVDTAGGLGLYGGYAYGPGDLGLGGGLAAGYPKGKASPGKPSIMGWGGIQFIPDGGVALGKSIDDVIRNLGPAVYDLMMADDAVAPAVAMLVYAVLGGEIHVEPAIVAEPGERLDETTDPKRLKDIADAKQYADEVKRSLNRVPEFLDEMEAILTEGVVRGSGLGDLAWEVVKEDGDEKPLTLLKSIQCRPSASWAMVVDPYGQFTQVAAYTPEGPRLFDRDRFFVYVNARKHGDPRGTSDLRPAYDAWNFKTQARPERSKYIATYSNPTILIEYDSNVSPAHPLNADGTEDTSVFLTPQAQAERVAANVHGASWMALPIPWKATLVESKNDGGAFSSHEEECNKAIIQAILLSSRTLSEAAHGSKADSQAAKSTTSVKVLRRQFGLIREVERSIFRTQTLMNHGEDAAARLCPRAKFPDPDMENMAAEITACVSAGYQFVPRQFAALDAKFGLPIRTADEIDELQAQKQATEQATVEAMKAKANPPDATQGPQEPGGGVSTGKTSDPTGKRSDAVAGKPGGKDVKPAEKAVPND